MDLHGYPWMSVDIHTVPWMSMDIHGCFYPWYPWIFVDINAYPLMSMDIHWNHGHPFICMNTQENHWIFVDNYGFPLISMDIHPNNPPDRREGRIIPWGGIGGVGGPAHIMWRAFAMFANTFKSSFFRQILGVYYIRSEWATCAFILSRLTHRLRNRSRETDGLTGSYF